MKAITNSPVEDRGAMQVDLDLISIMTVYKYEGRLKKEGMHMKKEGMHTSTQVHMYVHMCVCAIMYAYISMGEHRYSEKYFFPLHPYAKEKIIIRNKKMNRFI